MELLEQLLTLVITVLVVIGPPWLRRVLIAAQDKNTELIADRLDQQDERFDSLEQRVSHLEQQQGPQQITLDAIDSKVDTIQQEIVK